MAKGIGHSQSAQGAHAPRAVVPSRRVPDYVGTMVKDLGRVKVGDISLDRLTMQEAVNLALASVNCNNQRAMVIETVNAQFVCLARSKRQFSELISRADMVIADGISVVAASRVLGYPLPERVPGIDLLMKVCERAGHGGHSVYLLGGKPGVAEKAALHLQTQFPRLVVAGVESGFFATPEEEAAALDRIRTASPDFLFVGLGVPKQEYWMSQHSSDLSVKVMVGVGGSFDVLSGDIPRAPLWMQTAGMEWLFRLLREPRRLWRRYILGNMRFMQIVAIQWAAQRNVF